MIKILVHNKAFTLLNVIGLSIGLTSTILIISLVKYELSYDNFHKDAGSIYRVENDRIYSDRHDKSAGCPPALAPTLKNEFPEVIESARLYMTSATIVDASTKTTENIDKVFYADASFLRIFTISFLKGNIELILKDPYTVIISKLISEKYFGDESPINKVITLTNEFGKNNYTVTGVFNDIPPNTHVRFNMLISYETLINQNNDAKSYWGWNAFNTYVLLAKNTDPKLFEAKLPAMVEKYKNYESGYKRQYLLQPLKDIHLHSNLRFEPEVNGNADMVKFLSIIALFILILAWVNYVNLSTSNSFTRAKEVGIKKILGSKRIKLIYQFMTESFIINAVALILAVVTTISIFPYFSRFAGKPLSFEIFKSDWIIWVALFVLGTTLSGAYPAMLISSFSPLSIFRTKMKKTESGVDTRKVMVVFQFTVAIILIASTLIIYDQLRFMQNQKLGANIDQVIVLKTPAGIRNSVQLATTFKNELQSLPDVKFVTMSATIPGKNYSNASSGVRKFGSNPENGTQGFFIDVDEDYFKLYEIPLIAGRNFSPNSEFNKEIIINEEALKTYGFSNPEEAIHQKLTFAGFEGQNIEIVGVVKDYHQLSLKSSLQPVIFNPVNASNLNLNFFSVKVNSSNVKQSVDQIRAKWNKFYSDQPFHYSFLDEAFNAQYFADQQFGKVFGGFTILAIIISCLGLFSLSASTIQKRTKEIGIHKVNGARTAEVMTMLNKDFIKWVAIAFVIACPIAWYAMHKWLENFAYKTDLSWWVFAAAGAIAMLIALATVSFQSWRAATRNPVESLRYE